MDAPIHVLQLHCLTDATAQPARGWCELLGRLAPLGGTRSMRASLALIQRRRHEIGWLFRDAAAAGIDCHRLPSAGRWDPRLPWRLWRLIRRLRIDVVHAHDAPSLWLALVVEPFCRFRTVATAPDLDMPDLKTPDLAIRESGRRAARRARGEKLLPGFDRVVAANRQLAQQLVELGCRAGRVDVIPQGVDTAVFSRLPDADDSNAARAALDVPLTAHVVGVDLQHATPSEVIHALEALASIESALGPVYRVVLEDRLLAEQLATRDLPPEVAQRTRWVAAGEESPASYAALDAFVHVGHAARVPRSLLEAQSMEVPVVAADCPGTAELIKDGTTGLLVPPCDTEALTRSLARLLGDRREARAFAAAGRLRVRQRFHVGQQAQQMAETYYRVMSQV